MSHPSTIPCVISNIKILSNHVEDVSSLEAWKRSFIDDAMDERQKALAIWKSVVKFRHQARPPCEYLNNEQNVHDPIKAFNVYGYGQCCCASSHIEALARYVGLEARGWGLTGHSVPEVKIDGKWAMIDASLINYFPKPDGSIAGVEEIRQGILDWIAKNPQVQGLADGHMFQPFMANGQWRKGPAILAASQFISEDGFFPAHTHSWADAISEFTKGANFLYDYGVALGYQVNIQLRRGERIVRNWGNKGLHVDMAENGAHNMAVNSPDLRPGDMGYAAEFGDATDGRLGNGTLEYDLPLKDGVYRNGMLAVANLVDGGAPLVRVADGNAGGLLIFRMPCSYVYLSGQLDIDAVVGAGGSIRISFSDNNGLDWKPVATLTRAGRQSFDLRELVFRRYDYRLKFELSGAGTGLNSVRVSHDFQHSQRVLPILGQGDNTIRFSAGPQEGTITVEGRMMTSDRRVPDKKNLVFAEFHPVLENLAPPSLTVQGAQGSATIPIETPGDMTRLRVGIHCRARKAADAWTIAVSFDEGKTFIPVVAIPGPYKAISGYHIFTQIPAGKRSALVRVTGTQHLTPDEESQVRAGVDSVQESRILDLRIDADYLENARGFAPVKITYLYTDAGIEKMSTHIAQAPNEQYVIHCQQKPRMKSIALELA